MNHGRVTAAARALGLAQSTVSEALAGLERALGTRVILRGHGTHNARLTAAGRALLPHARTILAAVDRAHVAVAGITRSAPATVEIVANESVSTYVLPVPLAELRSRWPKTRFSVTVATCAGVRDGIAEGVFDVGFLIERADRNGREDRNPREPASAAPADDRVVVSEVPLVVFAGSSHPLVRRASRVPVRRAELAEWPVFVSDGVGDFHARRLFTHDRTGRVRLEATGSIEGVKRAVIASADAIGLLPAYAVAEELHRGTIARVNVRPAPAPMHLAGWLSPLRGRHPAAEELLHVLRTTAEATVVRRIS